MRRFFLLLVLLSTQINLFASPNAISYTGDDNALVVAQGKNGKYGYKINGEDKFVIRPKYVSAKPFSNGLAIVSIANKKYPLFGVIDTKGKYIIKPVYKAIEDFDDGLAKIETDTGWGPINANGDIILSPDYNKVEGFKDGLARVESINGWGLINRLGDLVLPPVYSTVERFIDGFARIKAESGWGLIDKDGSIRIKPIFKSMAFREYTELWECIDGNNFLSLYSKEGTKFLDGEEHFSFVELVGGVYKVEKEGNMHLLSYVPANRWTGALGQVDDLGVFTEVYLYRAKPGAAILAHKKDGGWELYREWGDQAVSGEYSEIDTTLCPTCLILGNNGMKRVYSVKEEQLIGCRSNTDYLDIRKGYGNDWVLIGEHTYSIAKESNVFTCIMGDYGVMDTGFAIEMLDNPDNSYGTYIIKNEINNNSKMVYSAGGSFDEKHKYESDYIITVWDRLTADIKDHYRDNIYASMAKGYWVGVLPGDNEYCYLYCDGDKVNWMTDQVPNLYKQRKADYDEVKTMFRSRNTSGDILRISYSIDLYVPDEVVVNKLSEEQRTVSDEFKVFLNTVGPYSEKYECIAAYGSDMDESISLVYDRVNKIIKLYYYNGEVDYEFMDGPDQFVVSFEKIALLR